MILVRLVQFIHALFLLLFTFGSFLLPYEYMKGFLIFLIATLIHWGLLGGKCILTIWEEKITKNPDLKPFNERILDSLNVEYTSEGLNKVEIGLMLGIIGITLGRLRKLS